MPSFIRWAGTTGGGGTGFTVSLTPASVSQYSPFVGDTVYAFVTALPTGGTAPYTYAWARLSGDTQIVIDSATSDAPTFSATGNPSRSVFYEAVWRLTVTDNTSAVITRDLPITFQIGGGPIE